MNKFYISLLVVCFALTTATAYAQRQIRIKPGDLKKMNSVKLEVDGRTYPTTLLYKAGRNEVTLLRETTETTGDGSPLLLPTKISLENVDKITIYSKKRKAWGMVIGGVGLGAASYFVVDQLYTNKLDNPFLEILNQAPEHRFMEPIVAAIIGAGVGVIAGELFSPVKIDMRKDRKEAYAKLRKYSYR